MSSYQQSPQNLQIEQLIPGVPAYLLGSFNYNQANTVMNVSSVALSGTTATVVGTVVRGNIPVAGQLITISGAVPSYFNVTNATVLTVSSAAAPDVGVYSVTFTLNNSNIGTTASPGIATLPVPEIAELLSGYNATTTASRAVSIQSNTGPNNGRSIRFDVLFPVVGTTSAVITAQSATRNVDSEFQDLGTVATLTSGTVAGGSAIFTDIVANFVRVRVSGLVNLGTSTVVAKVTI